MTDEILGRWTHSFEEDAGGVTVYRPAGYAFPPARGRAGLEFRPDGTFVDWSSGAADAPQGVPGRWTAEGGGRVRIEFEADARPGRTLQVAAIGGALRVVPLPE